MVTIGEMDKNIKIPLDSLCLDINTYLYAHQYIDINAIAGIIYIVMIYLKILKIIKITMMT
jgi:hypothetical protein